MNGKIVECSRDGQRWHEKDEKDGMLVYFNRNWYYWIFTVTHASIDWSHVDHHFNYMATDADGNTYLYTHPPVKNINEEGWEQRLLHHRVIPAYNFSSFVLLSDPDKHWSKSLVIRSGK